MRAFLVILVALSLSQNAWSAERNANLQLAAHARALESQSQATLGISLRQISLLLQADPHVFNRKETLEQDGSWPLLKDLEVKGFVEIHEPHTLPDGDTNMLGASVVQYRATIKGLAVVTAINTK